MTVGKAKKIIEESGLTEKTNKVLEVILGEDIEREMTSVEIRQMIALMELEVDEDRAESRAIDDKVWELKNFLSSMDNAADILEKELKSLQ